MAQWRQHQFSKLIYNTVGSSPTTRSIARSNNWEFTALLMRPM